MKTKISKSDLNWLVLAMAVKDKRKYINYIYSDGLRLVATDGNRMHILKDANIESGFYNKNMTLKHADDWSGAIRYPNISRIIPKDNHKEINFNVLKLDTQMYPSVETEVYNFDGLKINARYLQEAISYFDEKIIQYKNKTSAILIEDNNKLAVVMPIYAYQTIDES